MRLGLLRNVTYKKMNEGVYRVRGLKELAFEAVVHELAVHVLGRCLLRLRCIHYEAYPLVIIPGPRRVTYNLMSLPSTVSDLPSCDMRVRFSEQADLVLCTDGNTRQSRKEADP